MENQEGDRGPSSPEEAVLLNRNRSFKSKLLVRSQAVRETQSPPRASTPPLADGAANDAGDVSGCGDAAAESPPRSAPERCDVEEMKRRQQVEIQITSGAWDEPASEQRQRTRRWLGHHRQRSGSGSGSGSGSASMSHDLLSNSPRVTCVCGACAAGCRRTCPDCRGRRRRHACPAKQDSGIGCSDDCPDCSDTDTLGPNDSMDRPTSRPRKTDSLDTVSHDQQTFCRCTERPRNITLSRTDSDEKSEPTGADLVLFIKETLNKNPRDRITLLKIEKELHSLVSDTGRCIVRFPVMTSYGRMLVHRCASLFQLSHHLDQLNRGSVLVSKSGTSGGRIPCTAFRDWCVVDFPPSPHRQPDGMQAKSILKRDAHSLDDGTGGAGGAAGAGARSKSLEQREREYERVRRRIFSSEETQWSWLNSGPVKLLTSDGGRNKLLKVQSLETGGGPPCESHRGGGRSVSKSHSFGGYGRDEHPSARVLSRQGDLASSSWRLSPSSSGYKTLSLRSTDSVTPSPTGGVSPEPGAAPADGTLLWAITDLAAVPPGALIIHPQTGRPLANPDGSDYRYDPSHPPVLYNEQKIDPNADKRRGRLEKQHSFMDNECEYQQTQEQCRHKVCCCSCNKRGQDAAAAAGAETDAEDDQREDPCAECDPRPSEKLPPVLPEPKANGAVLPHCNSHYDAANCDVTSAQSMATHNPQTERDDRSGRHSQEGQAGYTPLAYKNDESQNLQRQITPTNYIQEQSIRPVQANYHDPNIRPISLSGMVYSAALNHTTYPYATAHCRMDHQLQQPMYHPHPMAQEMDQKHLPPAPHHPEPTFRIDQSYPYPTQPIPDPVPVPNPAGYPVGVSAHCAYAHNVNCAGACGVDPASGAFHCIIAAQRGYSFGVGYAPSMEGAAALMPSTYPLGNVLVPQPAIQQYQYSPTLQWPAGLQSIMATSNCATPVPKTTPPPNMYIPQQELPLAYHQPMNYKQQEIINYPNQIYPVYPNFGYPQCLVPQVLPQTYPICHPMLPMQEHSRRNSGVRSYESFQIKYNQSSKKNSISGSSRATPLESSYTPPADGEKRTTFDRRSDADRRKGANRSNSTKSDVSLSRQNSTELAVKIQQIKDQMAHLNVAKYDRNQNDKVINRSQQRPMQEQGRERKVNPGNGILGNYPVNSHFNNRIISNNYRPVNDEPQMSSAARAIVNTIRNLQAKNNFHKEATRKNQDYQPPAHHRNNGRPHNVVQSEGAARDQPTTRHSQVESTAENVLINQDTTDIQAVDANQKCQSDAKPEASVPVNRVEPSPVAAGSRQENGHPGIQDGGHPRLDPAAFVRNRPMHPMSPFPYRPYMFRPMSPGTWCRRSPGPLPHGGMHRAGPRRPPPDPRNGRR